MTTRATGTFEIDSWDEEPHDERERTRLARLRVAKTFLQGRRRGREHHGPPAGLRGRGGGSASYVGFERVEGRVHGRPGSFVLHHTATSSPEGRSATWSVLPDTGTGDLQGLRGEASASPASL